MIKERIIKIYMWCLNVFKPLRWLIECRKERSNIAHQQSIILGFKGRNLILLPHVDDEWIGCSQLLLKPEADVLMLDMDMPGGDTVNVHNQRKEELRHVGKTTNKPIQKVWDDKVESLRSVIEEWKPDSIFLPFFIDWHEEHIKVMQYLKSALEDLNGIDLPLKVAGYQVSAPIPEKYITHALTMNKKEWRNKWTLFKSLYPSQEHIPYKRFALQERVNGAYVKSFAAEVYSVNTVEEWIDLYNRLLPNEQEIKDLRNNLSSISGIRNTINTILCRNNTII